MSDYEDLKNGLSREDIERLLELASEDVQEDVKKDKKKSNSLKNILIAVIIAAVIFVGSAAFSGLYRECCICGEKGFGYKYVELSGEKYYVCPEHEEALKLAASFYTYGKEFTQGVYQGMYDGLTNMFGG